MPSPSLPSFPCQDPTALPFLPRATELSFIHSLLTHASTHPHPSSGRSEWKVGQTTIFATSFLCPSQPSLWPQSPSWPCLCAPLRYLPSPPRTSSTCKPFAAAFSFLGSRGLSFSLLSSAPSPLPHYTSLCQPRSWNNDIAGALSVFRFVLFSVLGMEPRH